MARLGAAPYACPRSFARRGGAKKTERQSANAVEVSEPDYFRFTSNSGRTTGRSSALLSEVPPGGMQWGPSLLCRLFLYDGGPLSEYDEIVTFAGCFMRKSGCDMALAW
jgi:hypothetical protein